MCKRDFKSIHIRLHIERSTLVVGVKLKHYASTTLVANFEFIIERKDTFLNSSTRHIKRFCAFDCNMK